MCSYIIKKKKKKRKRVYHGMLPCEILAVAEIEIIFSSYLCLIKKIIRLLYSNTKAITSMSLVLVKQLLCRLDSRKSNFGEKK